MNPIFPSWDLVHTFADMGTKSAIHLCGIYARIAVEMESDTSLAIPAGFDRAQINLHGDVGNPNRVVTNIEKLADLLNSQTMDKFILQHRGSWMTVPILDPRIEYLYDVSEGRGLASFEDWPEPEHGLCFPLWLRGRDWPTQYPTGHGLCSRVPGDSHVARYGVQSPGFETTTWTWTKFVTCAARCGPS